MADKQRSRRLALMLNDAHSIDQDLDLGLQGAASDNSFRGVIDEYSFPPRDDTSDCSDSEEEEFDTEASGGSTRRSRPHQSDGSSVHNGERSKPNSASSTSALGASATPDNEDEEDTFGFTFTEGICSMVMPRQTAEDYSEGNVFQCSCKLNKGQPCYTQFDADVIDKLRLCYIGMTKKELDTAILAHLSCGIHMDQEASPGRSKQERMAMKTSYLLHGHFICKDFFKFVHSISQDKLAALIGHYTSGGLGPRQHKSSKQPPLLGLSFQDTKRVVDFLVNYAELNAVLLRGSQPGHLKANIRRLPSKVTDTKVYIDYCEACETSKFKPVGKSTFYRLWQQLLPFVVTKLPSYDLCMLCQKTTVSVLQTANLSDEVKARTLRDLMNHLDLTKKEISYYQQVCENAKASFPSGTALGQEPKSACSFKGSAHYSFDFSQQVHYPNNPVKPSPLSFKTTRKCGLFGVACEAIPCQVNFLLEECVSAGKGTDYLVSLLHFFFEKYGIGEEHVHLHAYNCGGESKNNCLMQYFMWRVLTGRHRSIKLSYLQPGHSDAKLACDWYFGLMRRKYRMTQVNCLEDISTVINESATCSISQLCGTEKGEVLVPMYAWTKFLGHFFKTVQDVRKFHHFHFDSPNNFVSCKEFVDSEPEKFDLLLRDISDVTAMPCVLKPPGFAPEREWYLFNEVREFVPEELKDLVAPKPLCP